MRRRSRKHLSAPGAAEHVAALRDAYRGDAAFDDAVARAGRCATLAERARRQGRRADPRDPHRDDRAHGQPGPVRDAGAARAATGCWRGSSGSCGRSTRAREAPRLQHDEPATRVPEDGKRRSVRRAQPAVHTQRTPSRLHHRRRRLGRLRARAPPERGPVRPRAGARSRRPGGRPIRRSTTPGRWVSLLGSPLRLGLSHRARGRAWTTARIAFPRGKVARRLAARSTR